MTFDTSHGPNIKFLKNARKMKNAIKIIEKLDPNSGLHAKKNYT